MYDSVTFRYKESNLLGGSMTVKKVKTYGMSRGTVKTLKSEFTDDTMAIQAELFFPKVFATGNYQSNMSFNAFRIESKGQYNITMRDITAKWNIKGKLENIDGEDYMKLYKFDILPEAEDMKISVSGIFPDPVLSE